MYYYLLQVNPKVKGAAHFHSSLQSERGDVKSTIIYNVASGIRFQNKSPE